MTADAIHALFMERDILGEKLTRRVARIEQLERFLNPDVPEVTPEKE